MARGAAPGQVSTLANRGASRPSGPNVGSAGAGALRRRLGGLGGGNSGKDKLLRFYTDDAPGLKLPPLAVLIMSLCFVAFVTVLHVVGKIASIGRGK